MRYGGWICRTNCHIHILVTAAILFFLGPPSLRTGLRPFAARPLRVLAAPPLRGFAAPPRHERQALDVDLTHFYERRRIGLVRLRLARHGAWQVRPPRALVPPIPDEQMYWCPGETIIKYLWKKNIIILLFSNFFSIKIIILHKNINWVLKQILFIFYFCVKKS